MEKKKGNAKHLRKPFTPEEARKYGKMGAKKSAEVRRMRKSLAETLKIMLSCKIPKSSPLYKKLKTQMANLGLDWEPTVQDLPTLGMIQKAGANPLAFVAIRDTIGEKPVEQVEDLTPPPNISIGLLPEVKPASEASEEDTES